MRVSRAHAGVLPGFWVAALTFPTAAYVQEEHGSQDLAKQLANPVASLISVPFQYNTDFKLGPASDGIRDTLNIQPVVPVSLNERWNLISRSILPVIHQNNVAVGAGDQFGLGHLTQSFFFSPSAPGPGGLIWGAGPILTLDTATNDLLGPDQWSAGPTLVVLQQEGEWTIGALASHVWSYAGDAPDTSSTFLQPFVNHVRNGTTLGVNLEATYDWKGADWTIPVNLTASKVTKLGEQLVSIGGGIRYYAETPEGGPEWGTRIVFTLLFPAKKRP